MTASNIIKSMRGKYGLTQSDMAKRLNITRQHYNKLENNPTKASLDKIYEIFYSLNESIDEFLYALKDDYKSNEERQKE